MFLKKGQKKKVTLSIPARSLSYFDPVEDKYLLQSGRYSIQIASSCENVKISQDIYIKSTDVINPENVDSLNSFIDTQNKNWEKFYKFNKTNFFKDRHYILEEFQELMTKIDQ